MKLDSPIKEYSHVDKDNKEVKFRISRIEEYYAKRPSEPDLPHKHDFYTILLVNKGKGQHNIDFNSYEIKDHQIYFLGPGQVHQVVEEEQSFGFSIVFSEEFLIKINLPSCFIFELNLFNVYGSSPPIDLNAEHSKRINNYCEEIFKTDSLENNFKENALGAQLQLLLIYCNSLLISENRMNLLPDSGNYIFKKFRELVEEKYSTWHAASQYADELNITPDHLNRIIKSTIGKTTKEYIHARLAIAAKRMLYFSDLTNKEVGYKLGFSEPSNFSAFFKKTTGFSPNQFKKAM